jgi:hypothetical protein
MLFIKKSKNSSFIFVKNKSSRKKIGGNMEKKKFWYHFLQMTMCFIKLLV